MLDPLRMLADLLESGRSPAEAFTLLTRTGGPMWAAEAAAAMSMGGDPAQALARAGALDPTELDEIGGAAHLLEPSALRLIARRRAVRGAARRAALWALVLPGIAALSVASWSALLPRGLGARVVDLLPLAAVVGATVLAARPAVAARIARLMRSRPRWAEPDTLRILWAAAPLDAAGFERATRLLPPGPVQRACERAGRRLIAGDRIAEALPSAAEIGPANARAVLAAAAGTGAALSEAVDVADRITIARWRFAARLGGWAAVLWVGFRLSVALLTVDLGGAGGLEGLLPQGLDPGAFEDLLREIEGR